MDLTLPRLAPRSLFRLKANHRSVCRKVTGHQPKQAPSVCLAVLEMASVDVRILLPGQADVWIYLLQGTDTGK